LHEKDTFTSHKQQIEMLPTIKKKHSNTRKEYYINTLGVTTGY
jgi:hypothetical protein